MSAYKIVTLLIFVFVSSDAFSKGSCKSSDHWGLFYNGKTRDQGKLGSCHSFATTGMLEAKLKQMKINAGDFSEKDLFILHYIEKSQEFIKSCGPQTGKRFEDLRKKLGKIKDKNLWYSEEKRKKKMACSTILNSIEGGEHI